MNDFFAHFKYFPKYPPRLDFDRVAFAKELDQCIEDDFDYTIKKYGTIPTNWFDTSDIIID